jgi:hypothetical protein
MSAESGRVDARLEEMAARLGRIEERLAALESGVGRSTQQATSTQVSAGPRSHEPSGTTPSGDVSTPVRWLSLAGRTLLVLAGAYLIRAFRDVGELPPLVPALVGLAYAASWLLAAARERGARRPDSAVVHVVSATLISLPLVTEATLRFGIFSPEFAAALVTAATLASLMLARHLRSLAVAWIAEGGAVAAMIVLAVGTRQLLPTAAGLLVLAVVLEALSVERWWRGLRWPPAIGLDLILPFAVFLVSLSGGVPEAWRPLPASAVAACVGLAVLIYGTGTVARTLVRRQVIGVFGVVQPLIAVAIGVGATVGMSGPDSSWPLLTGIAALLAGGGSYAAAFARVDRRRGHSENFYFYSTVGGLLMLAGATLSLGAGWLASFASLLSLGAALVGSRWDRFTLRCHAAVYAVTAAISCGQLSAGTSLLLGASEATPPMISVPFLVATFSVIAAYAVLLARSRSVSEPVWRFAPELLAGLAASWLVLIASVEWGAGALALAGFHAPVAVATLGTTVLALLATLLSWRATRASEPDTRALGWMLLAAGAVKLVAVDLRLGSAVASCVSLAFLGAALTVMAKLSHREDGAGVGERS